MDTIPIILLLAGILLSAILFSRTALGQKIGNWLWPLVLFLAFGAFEFLRGFRGGKRTTPEIEKPTPTTPSSPDIEDRAELAIQVDEALAPIVKPASSLEEFMKIKEEDGL